MPRLAFLALIAAGAALLAMEAIRRLQAHPEVSLRHFAKVSAAGAVHMLVYALVWRLSSRRVRATVLYLASSAAVFFAVAGPCRALSVGILVAAAAVLSLVGGRIARRLLPAGSLSLGVSLGFGIAAASVAATLLAAFEAFRPWPLAAIATLGIAWGLPGTGDAVRAFRARFALLEREADGWTAAGWEIVFLFAGLRLVHGLTPETGSDAASRYLPYVKMLWHFHRLPDLPWQFPFILPQAGLTYAAFFGFAPAAQRGAFLLAFAAAAALAVRRCRASRELALGTILVLASCPIVAAAAHGLQPDAFGWMVVLLLGVMSVEGSTPGTVRFGAACGALAALCWSSKYSTLGFAAPLVAWALWRARADAGWKGLAKMSAGGMAGAAVAGAPWLFHTWRLTGNPFFPMLSRLLPSPLWRMRIDAVWGGGFVFEKGWRGLLLWPIDMTFHPDRYVETGPGGLGFLLLVFLALAVVSLPFLDRTERIWLGAAVFGTAMMWTRTPYLRYWFPAYWLAAPAAASGARRLSQSRLGRSVVVAALLAVAAGQVWLGAFHSRPALEGRDWRIFFRRTSEARALAVTPGLSALERLRAIDGSWPKIWWTRIPMVGHGNVIPLLGEPWELSFHVPDKDPEALFRYIDSVGCRYWIVRNGQQDRKLYTGTGIAPRYWKQENIVVRDKFATIYRLPEHGPPPL